MPVPILHRLTTEFSEAEDRLRLSGEDKDGAVVVVWLTQRLARRLHGNLIKWLDGGADADDGTLLQEFIQQQAEFDIAPERRVETAGAQAEWLAFSIQLTTGDDAVAMRFVSAADDQASVGFTTTELRQWLAICLKIYRKAEWPMDVWPDWMADPKSPEADPQGRIVIH